MSSIDEKIAKAKAWLDSFRSKDRLFFTINYIDTDEPTTSIGFGKTSEIKLSKADQKNTLQDLMNYAHEVGHVMDIRSSYKMNNFKNTEFHNVSTKPKDKNQIYTMDRNSEPFRRNEMNAQGFALALLEKFGLPIPDHPTDNNKKYLDNQQKVLDEILRNDTDPNNDNNASSIRNYEAEHGRRLFNELYNAFPPPPGGSGGNPPPQIKNQINQTKTVLFLL